MRLMTSNKEMIAKCGLYCGACPKFLKEKCNGCRGNDNATWCKLRTCCMDKNIPSCADCNEFSDVMACGKYNNFMARIFGFVFNSDRSACIDRIKAVGYDRFADEMTGKKEMSYKRK